MEEMQEALKGKIFIDIFYKKKSETKFCLRMYMLNVIYVIIINWT